MSTRFKNTSTGIWKDFSAVGTKWRFDVYGVTPKVIQGTLEELICEAYSGVNNSGNLSASTELFTCELAGTVDVVTIGSIDSTLENLESTLYGTFVENYIIGVLEKLQCTGYANMGLECTLEPLVFEAQSLFGASITATFDYIDLTFDGNATFVSFEPLLKKLGVTLHAGASLNLEFKEPYMSSQAFIQLQGDIHAQMSLLTFESYSGHAIVAALNPIGFYASANNPIFGTLSLKTQNFTCSMVATTQSVNSLLADLRQLTHRASGIQINPGEEPTLLGTLKTFQAELVGINGLVADLEADFNKFVAELVAGSVSYNKLIGVLETFEMTSISFTGTGIDPTDCEPYKTLEFGD